MVQKQSIVRLPSGLHALNVTKIKNLISGTESVAFIKKGSQTVNCRDIVGLLSLQVKPGDMITVLCDGIDEEDTLKQLVSFLENDDH